MSFDYQPRMEGRKGGVIIDAAGATAGLGYKFVDGTGTITVSGAGEVCHGVAYMDGVQNDRVGLDTEGDVIMKSSEAIVAPGALEMAAAGKVRNFAAGKKIGYANSDAAGADLDISVHLELTT